MNRLAATAGMAMLLSACTVVPTSVTIASFALDGISLAASDRTFKDHALSSVVDEDCIIWRLFENKAICHEYETGEGPVLLAGAHGGAYPDGSEFLSRERAYIGQAPPEPTPDDRSVILAAMPPRQEARGFVVIGSFSDPGNAGILQAAYPSLDPKIRAMTVAGAVQHRVVVGPVNQSETEAAFRRISASGIDGAWLLSGGEPPKPYLAASVSR